MPANLDRLNALIARLPERNPPATDEEIQLAEKQLKWPLPPDYRHFLRQCDGFTGWLTERSFLRISSAAELVEYQGYIDELQPRKELIVFGSNGGGEGLFFDMNTSGPTVLMISFISDWDEDALWHGDSFTDFLDRALRDWSPFDELRHC